MPLVLRRVHVACARRAWRTLSTSAFNFPPLPVGNKWKEAFPSTLLTRDRFNISNPETAAKLADEFIPHGSKDKVIIEAFPGPGGLTRALLDLPRERVRKVVVLEDHEPYLDYLRPLEQDPRVVVIPKSAAFWDTFPQLESAGILSSDMKSSWESGIHPHLHFIGHVPRTGMGEQLVSQFLRCVPESAWLFQYGRMPMSFLMSEWLWTRMAAPPGDINRCKLTIIAEATAEQNLAVPVEELMPYVDHWHPLPSIGNTSTTKRIDHRKIGAPVVAVNITPLARPFIENGLGDKWDYILRRLFVKKATPLEKCIGNLAPGAEDLLRRIMDPELPENERLDVKKAVRQFNVAEWAIIAKAFDDWPFAPEDLLITDAFNREEEGVHMR